MNNKMKTATLVLGLSALAVNVFATDNVQYGINNTISADNSTVLGSASVATADSSLAVGRNSYATGIQSTAIGMGTRATAKASTAIGTSAVATEQSSSAFGQSAKATGLGTTAVGTDATASGNYAVALGQGSTASGVRSFAQGYSSVAAETNSIAIGTNAKAIARAIAIGEEAVATSTATSSVVIGRTNNVSGADTVVIGANNKDVTANQSMVIGYNNTTGNKQEQVIVGVNNTTDGQGAVVIGSHGQATAIDAIAIGNNTLADTPNGVALGTNSTTDTPISTANTIINGNVHTFAGGTANSTVSVGTSGKAGLSGVTEYKRTLTNVAAGRISDTSTDAINGSQLYATIQEIDNNGNNIKQNTADIRSLTTIVDNHDAAITNNTNVINNHEQRITTLENRAFDLTKDVNNRVSNVEQRMNKLGASSAALSGLHPLDFNKNDKASYAISYGHYRNANAVAMGGFYRPNEHTMFGVGVSLGGETQLTLNASFRLGKGSDYVAEAKDDNARISKLEALVNKLMEELKERNN